MKKPIILFLFALLTSFLFSQTLVKLKLPNNCNSNNTVTQNKNLAKEKKSKVELFPNPNAGVFTLIISFKDLINKATITVYDTNGKSVYYETVYSDSNKLVKQIRIAGLYSGKYLFEVKNAQQVSSTKLVIIK